MSEGFSFSPDRSVSLLAEYTRLSTAGNAQGARKALLDTLAGHAEGDWLDCGRALVLRADLDGAAAVFSAALAAHPQSIDVQHALAGVLWQAKQFARAETLLRALLARHPDNVAATFVLARLLKEQARMNAAAAIVRSLFDHTRQSVGITIQAVELLDDCGCKQAASDICESEIAHGSTDPRLYAYAGMLALQLGDFDRVRERYSFALAHSAQAPDWQVANGLAAAQRYSDEGHADFELFRGCLQRPDLSERARASLLFALGKAYDDIGDTARAAESFREGNRVVSGFAEWSRKNWRRMIAARLDSKPLQNRVTTTSDCVPVFIVGMPRSGSTLIADLLARHPDVRYRGELTWLPFLAQRVALAGKPTAAVLEKTAAQYLAQLRQDDPPARFYIDKQPLNFLHVDLIEALFPAARIIYCERSERDTALSIWMQYFAGPEENFAYDFADIAAVAQGCSRLMANALKKAPHLIRAMRYEELVSDPATCMAALAVWLGLPDHDPGHTDSDATAISTSSLWQVRQPIYTRSIGRWRAYAAHIPELLQFADR